MTDVIIIGGGPAGLFAAYHAAINGNSVILFEKNDRCGRKLNITGKGRCNLTNDCDREEFLQNVIANPRFLMGAISRFSTEDTKAFFESLGVPLKTERGNRVFPQSDKASDITDALVNAVKTVGVEIIHRKVSSLIISDGKILGVRCGKDEFTSKSVIIACGGASYPRTGSDGGGHRLAESAGHKITTIRPSLVPLVSRDKICGECMGLSLKNVGVSFYKDSKKVYYEQGEMMFTHFGLTGPVILSASAHLTGGFPFEAFIDLKPALDEKTLDKRLLRDFSENQNRELKNGFSALLPSKLIEPFIKLTGIPPETRLNSLTKEQRGKILSLMKALPVKIVGTRPIDEAIVTGGGVDCKEIDPKTMESKIVSGLYFAGEVMDLDAYTGGFNLQIAFSTGFVAGSSQG
ncbi:MAG: NAD(P)/FAD-dependent oxidoreductase [Ruminococcaceae bacterium]|nr:NAD(P)/FAD-dependent oxidoreductase [Oscillospiraceae bacterium]